MKLSHFILPTYPKAFRICTTKWTYCVLQRRCLRQWKVHRSLLLKKTHINIQGKHCWKCLEMTELYPKFPEKLRIQTSHDSTINAEHSGMWHCVFGQVHSSWKLEGLLDHEDDNIIDHLKHQSLLVQWHSATLQKTEILATLLWEPQISQKHSDLGHSAHFTNTAVLLTCTMPSL